MSDQLAPRIMATLAGNIERQPGIQAKYGLFLEALARAYPLAGVIDVSLHGLPRVLNAISVAHPDRAKWRERFYQNVPAFRSRSRRVARCLARERANVDVTLQIGVLYDACWHDGTLPNVIYTDYTALLSARSPDAGRSPFTDRQRESWVTLERQAYERATHVCTRSEFVRASIVEDYGISPDRVTVVGGGLNFSPFPDPPTRPPTSSPTVLFIGKELYRKGGDVLLQAFSVALASVPEARLILVTSDSIPSRLPLDSVDVIKPTWDRKVIATLFQRADVFVLPSRLETWGDVLLEAMAFGLPCIGVAGGVMEEIIQDETTGSIVAPGDRTALAATLTRLLQDESLRACWGAAGRRRVAETFTWDRVVGRIAPAIEVAASRHRSPT